MKMKSISPIVVLAIALALSGCLPANYLANANINSVSNLGSENGIIVMTITSEKVLMSSQGLRYRNLTTEEYGVANVKIRMTKYPIHEEARKGAVVALELPAGRYEFYNIQLYSSSGISETSYSRGREDLFSVPFSVESGEIKYLGDVRIDYSFGTNFIGMKGVNGGSFSFSDRFDEDYEYIRKKLAGIEKESVVRAVPRAGENLKDTIKFE